MSAKRGDDRNQTRWTGQDAGRSAAEWTTLGISLTVLLSLLALVTYEYVARGTEPPVVEVKPLLQSVRHERDGYYLPIQVTNVGDLTAEDVRIQVTLRDGESRPESSQVLFGFLAGGETNRAVVVFRGDPSKGSVTAETVSFISP